MEFRKSALQMCITPSGPMRQLSSLQRKWCQEQKLDDVVVESEFTSQLTEQNLTNSSERSVLLTVSALDRACVPELPMIWFERLQ